MGVPEGGRVAETPSPDSTHVLLEVHYGVPFAGTVLVALNTRLTAADLVPIVSHSGAQVLIYDYEFEGVARGIAAQAGGGLRLVRAGRPEDQYETCSVTPHPGTARWRTSAGLLSINYTSGTTGKPKGVMYHHRGAYLQALAMALHTRLD